MKTKSRRYPTRNEMLLRSLPIMMIATLLLASTSTSLANAVQKSPSSFRHKMKTSPDSFRSNITVPVSKNLTISSSNNSADLPSQMNPTLLTVDVVRGLEPARRFNSQFNATLVRKSHVSVSSLREVDHGLSLFFNVSQPTNVSIAAYELLLERPQTVSGNDFISIALSTDSSYDSTEAYIGISLLLRDQQGNRHYVSVEVSDRYSVDAFSMSKWFLGWGFVKEYAEYPHYSFRYGSELGPWFVQLSLSESFQHLNLSSALLESLLIGAEIFSLPRTLEEVDAVFHYITVHTQPFLINQRPVNSTVVAFPYEEGLIFSGIECNRVNVSGSLRPSNEKEDILDSDTVSRRESSFDLAQAVQAGFTIEGNVKITVFSKNVKECLLTFDDETVDLTQELLSAVLYNNAKVYTFPNSTSTLKVLLILYKFNAWMFSFSGFGGLEAVNVTKTGIVEEYFSIDKNEGVITINASEATYGSANLAVKTDNLTPKLIKFNGVERLIESILIIEMESHLVIPLSGYPENIALYTVEYVFSDQPLYGFPTVTPFNVYLNGSALRIFTPFNVEGEQGFPIPLTLQMITFRTLSLKIESNSSFLEIQQDEIMAYSSRIHYEYFMLKPLKTGQSTVVLKIVDPFNEKTYFSSLFLVRVSASLLYQIVPHLLVCVTVISVVVAVLGKILTHMISRKGLT